MLCVAIGTSRVPPGATCRSTPPNRTVTVMVCGASTALGSLTVTTPVERPAARLPVESAS